MNAIDLIVACFAGIFVLAVGAGIALKRYSDEMTEVLRDKQDDG